VVHGTRNNDDDDDDDEYDDDDDDDDETSGVLQFMLLVGVEGLKETKPC
jgi:hypothetical protein